MGLASRIALGVASDMKNKRPVDTAALLAVAGGVLFSLFLGLMRVRFLWWPFHPVGFALAHSFWCSVFWFTAMLAWAAKALVLRYGGATLHRKMFHLCAGLLVGGWAWQAVTILHRVTATKGPQAVDWLYRLIS
jgi:hypothetical protein